MEFVKSFIQNTCKLSVKLFPVIVSSSLFICCVGGKTKPISPQQNQIAVPESAININTASARELEKLPHVGEKTARKIIEHRDKFGEFRRAEHLLLVEGVGDGHFREMRNFVKVE